MLNERESSVRSALAANYGKLAVGFASERLAANGRSVRGRIVEWNFGRLKRRDWVESLEEILGRSMLVFW